MLKITVVEGAQCGCFVLATDVRRYPLHPLAKKSPVHPVIHPYNPRHALFERSGDFNAEPLHHLIVYGGREGKPSDPFAFGLDKSASAGIEGAVAVYDAVLKLFLARLEAPDVTENGAVMVGHFFEIKDIVEVFEQFTFFRIPYVLRG